jgi:HlyD family secretion protein
MKAWGIAALCLLLAACGGDKPRLVQGYVDIDLIRLAPSQSGRLDQLLVRNGDPVQAGQRLFHLDATPESATAEASHAHVEAAQATARDLNTGKRPAEIDVIRAQLQQARATLKLAQDQLQRSQAVFAKGFVSQDQLDQQQAAVKQAQAHAAELEASLASAQLAARSEARKSAIAAVAQAAAQNRADVWRLDEKTVSAPETGYIQQVYFRPGEWVNAGQPVLDIYVNSRVKIRFFVAETIVSTLKPGATVQVACDGCAPFHASIRFISRQAEFTPPEIYSRGQREKLLYLVEAAPEHPERLHAGQPVDVTLPDTTTMNTALPEASSAQ